MNDLLNDLEDEESGDEMSPVVPVQAPPAKKPRKARNMDKQSSKKAQAENLRRTEEILAGLEPQSPPTPEELSPPLSPIPTSPSNSTTTIQSNTTRANPNAKKPRKSKKQSSKKVCVLPYVFRWIFTQYTHSNLIHRLR